MSTQSSPCQDIISIKDTKSLIDALEELIKENVEVPRNELESSFFSEVEQPEVNAFSVGKAPKVDLDNYFSRLIKYCKLQRGTFIAMMIYLDKAAEKIDFTKLNIHRLILGALVCAIKYTCDICGTNIYYSKVGGVSAYELCVIENCFLELLDYNLYISNEEYEKYFNFLRE